MDIKKCIICESQKYKPFYSGLIQCQNCTHVIANQLISDDELYRMYGKKYFFGEGYIDYISDRRVFKKNFELRLKTLFRFLVSNYHQNLFEVGCAYGFFLDVARKYFTKVWGIDISENGVQYAQNELGLDAAKADLLEYEFKGRPVEIACMWDTIEHLKHPHLLMRPKVYRHHFAKVYAQSGCLKKDAIIFGSFWRLHNLL